MRDTPSTVLLLGHGGYYNRGCEAIVESTVAMLREARPGLRFVLASLDETRDRLRTPAVVDRIEPGVASRNSPWMWVARVLTRLSPRAAARWIAEPVRRVLPEADIVLSVGGDNYCYADWEYAFYVDAATKALGKPLVLWGATVELPSPSAAKLADLRRFNVITARESRTVKTLARHGIERGVHLVADPAFTLEPRPLDTSTFWPGNGPVLGLNLSPLVGRYAGGGSEGVLQAAVALSQFAVDKAGMRVLLIPHVTEPMPSTEKWNDDAVLLEKILREVDRPTSVSLMPSDMGAAQTKFVIARCDLFVGARTHSTIAGLSSGVPTLTVAYSAKAHGINEDLFGDGRWVLDVSEFRPAAAIEAFQRLQREAASVRAHLQRAIPAVKASARSAASIALALLEPSRACDSDV
jgi:colanic acid/amylovoran biosynthesis protein